METRLLTASVSRVCDDPRQHPPNDGFLPLRLCSGSSGGSGGRENSGGSAGGVPLAVPTPSPPSMGQGESRARRLIESQGTGVNGLSLSTPPHPPRSGDLLSLGASGPRPGPHPHVPVWHHIPTDLSPQLVRRLLGLHGVGHRHLPPRALRLLPAAPRQRRARLRAEPRLFDRKHACELKARRSYLSTQLHLRSEMIVDLFPFERQDPKETARRLSPEVLMHGADI